MTDFASMIEGIARAGARGYQLRFARERLEKLTHKIKTNGDPDFDALRDWIAGVEYAIAQIKAAEGPGNGE